jgi:hypothetical protein
MHFRGNSLGAAIPDARFGDDIQMDGILTADTMLALCFRALTRTTKADSVVIKTWVM